MLPDLHPSPRQVKSFGLFWLPLALGAAIAWRLDRSGDLGSTGLVCLAAAITSVLVTLLAPAGTRLVFTALNVLTFPIAWLVRLSLLGLIFTLVVTPIGWCLRLRGHDPLQRRRPAPGASLWKSPRPKGGIEGYFR